ncbi:unnamed protein product [Parascedosporium putredinis]|uniref:Histone chaperone domain-containing protein n=1 Tax=Parascedosporium putredinis TaxID=1442378 RepID=A0A9P1H888_9PEZI|nr:unnamed protein product [Parascedosporium putredinis]CAI7999517.1 unnamed protein product [Parascedosporium putredinis]
MTNGATLPTTPPTTAKRSRAGDAEEEEEEEEEDDFEAINTNNIINSGRRTRGRVIDFAKAAQENPR